MFLILKIFMAQLLPMKNFFIEAIRKAFILLLRFHLC